MWCCLPRFDSEPVFSSLLDEERGGRFVVAPAGGGLGIQRYWSNTNVLQTTFHSEAGAFRIIDFAPRFMQNDRSFRPTMLIRIVDPIEGTPRIRVACEPRLGWSREAPKVVPGSHHLQYEGFEAGLRLLDSLTARGELASYHLLPAARADLLWRLGRTSEAADAYRAALALVRNEPERRFLGERLAATASAKLPPSRSAR